MLTGQGCPTFALQISNDLYEVEQNDEVPSCNSLRSLYLHKFVIQAQD